jgi:serine/threonine protein phosphatase 1
MGEKRWYEMVYCISDIHGEIDRFRAMLSLIHFSDEDTLYILGDVIDRFPGGIDILRIIMDSPNMIMLLGNHEQMCIDTLGPLNVYGGRDLWTQNGGESTYHELLHVCSPSERQRIIQFLLRLPDHLDIEVEGTSYHLVHGAPSDDPHIRIWDRPNPNAPAPFQDRITIVGHTPTCFLNGDKQSPQVIWEGNGIIDIDCSCGHELESRRLACLCLNDRKVFYV